MGQKYLATPEVFARVGTERDRRTNGEESSRKIKNKKKDTVILSLCSVEVPIRRSQPTYLQVFESP